MLVSVYSTYINASNILLVFGLGNIMNSFLKRSMRLTPDVFNSS